MRIFKLILKGFRRFEDASVDLGEQLIALIGPNEAGKSSVLDALVLLNSNEPISPRDLTRRLPVAPEDKVITARFLLDEADLPSPQEIGSVGSPRWYILSKKANGKLVHWIEPSVSRDKNTRASARDRAKQVLNRRGTIKLLERLDKAERESGAAALSEGLQARLDSAQLALSSSDETLPKASLESISELVAELSGLDDGTKNAAAEWLADLGKLMQAVVTKESTKHPQDLLLSHLDKRRPLFLMFGDDERNLLSEYSNEILADPPPALRNLLSLAGLDANMLLTAIRTGDHGFRTSLEEGANERLRERFVQAWKQSGVFPRIKIDTDVTRIMVRTADTYSPISERSDGLRAFIALYTYTSLHSASETRPILLVDEAERHLHYDAQVDLIQVFARQQAAQQIVYTTHSAASLPFDLGAGIRVAVPLLAADGSDIGRSTLQNSFWQQGAGFSAMLLAMGATVLAFAPTQRAVIAEGPSDSMVLPTLFREGLGVDRLEFQVAPGLATVSAKAARELDLEAPRVAYLLDGDEAGREHQRKLTGAGIPIALIVRLDESLVLEDYVAQEVLLRAVNEVLRRSHGTQFQLDAGTIPEQGATGAIQRWSEAKGIPPPNRVAIARAILEQRREGTLLRTGRRQSIVAIHNRLAEALGIAVIRTEVQPGGPTT